MSFLLTKFNKAKEQYRWLNYEICSDIEVLCNGKIIEPVDSHQNHAPLAGREGSH